MSDDAEFSLSAVRHKRAQHPSAGRPEYSAPEPPGFQDVEEPKSKPKFDTWRLVAALKQHWRWLGAGAAVVAGVGFVGGYLQANFHARVTLIASNTAGEASGTAGKEGFQPRHFTPQTLISLMSSPELAGRVAAKTKPAVSPGALIQRAQIAQVPDTELVALTMAGKNRRELVDLANLYADEAVALGKELQVAESHGLTEFCESQLKALDGDVQKANEDFITFQNTEKLADPDAERQVYIKQLGEIMAKVDNLRIEAGITELQVTALQNELSQQNPVAQKLQAAKNKLADLQTRLTDIHPYVQAQRKEIAELEKQAAAVDPKEMNAARFNENALASALYMRLMDAQSKKAQDQKELQELDKLKLSLQEKVTGLSDKAMRYANLKARLDGLQKSRTALATRLGDVQLFQKSAQGYYRVFAPATEPGIYSRARWRGGVLGAAAGALLGFMVMGLFVAGRELTDGKLKTAADVERVTGLPVLASLGDLSKMSVAEQEAWAFRTWTALAGQLNSSPNRGMVCGFISSSSGEGCSTWVKLLADAANRRGLRAGVMTAKHGVMEPVSTETRTSSASEPVTASERAISTTPPAVEIGLPATRHTTATELLTVPAQAQIPLPGRVWSLEQRKEWQTSLNRWHAMDNLVVLVDLPPASISESVLLAENLPQLIWLADSGNASVRATREQLQTLRHARCRIVGAVLNHEPKPVFKL